MDNFTPPLRWLHSLSTNHPAGGATLANKHGAPKARGKRWDEDGQEERAEEYGTQARTELDLVACEIGETSGRSVLAEVLSRRTKRAALCREGRGVTANFGLRDLGRLATGLRPGHCG